MSKSSKSLIEAVNRYNAKNTKTVLLRFNNKTDADLLKYLDTIPKGQKATLFKELLRNFIMVNFPWYLEEK